DRLPHGLMERSRRKGIMTGRQCKGTNTCVVAERVLEIELIAHLSDESNRMFTRSESPFHRQLGDVLAIVGADSRPLGIEVKPELTRHRGVVGGIEAGHQRVFTCPIKSPCVPASRLARELRGMTASARLRADKLLLLRDQRRQARESDRQQALDYIRQYSNFNA